MLCAGASVGGSAFCGNADPMVGGGDVMAGTIVGIVSLAAIIVVAFVVNIKMNK